MNGSDFYDEFKAVLDYFGLGWGDKAVMKVSIENNKLCFEYQDRRILISLEGE